MRVFDHLQFRNRVRAAFGSNARWPDVGTVQDRTHLGGRAASGDIDLDPEELVEAISDVMRKKGTAFGLFIDEMQDLDPILLGGLLGIQHRASQREWPFFVIGAGLPSLPAVIAESRSYAERQFSYRTIGPLSPTDAADALRVPVEAPATMGVATSAVSDVHDSAIKMGII